MPASFNLARASLSRITLCLFAAGGLLAQDPLTAWMDGIAQRQLDRRDAVIASVRTPAAAEKRRAEVRARVLDLIGGLPDYNGPLNASITGRVSNPVYTLEKLIFESLPGFYVTANVYRPNGGGRHPAVLLSTGHTTTGKTENHRIGANLAAKGFVAVVTDPIGLGERIQAMDAKRRHAGGCCANEHLQAGALSMLIGQSVARYFIQDAKRAIDYLATREDVDAQRIGAAGCSGGGCVTTYIAALDARVKAAAPACFLNSLRVLFRGPFPDSEMSLPGFLAAGLDHADFLALAAPMPYLILATEGDFFTPPGVRIVYEEARRWYGLYGAEDRIGMFIGPGPHGTPLETRERLYEWMIRWLKHGKGEAKEDAATPLYPDAELVVTASGQVQEEPGSRKLHEVIREEYRARRRQGTLAELSAELRRLGIPTNGRAPAARAVGTALRVAFESEPGVEIRATLTLPKSAGRHGALVLVADGESHVRAEQAAAAGEVVMEVEPRDAISGYDRRPYLGNWVTNERADSIGRNLAAMRAHDILRAVDLLAARADVDASRIRGAANGVRGVWMLLAAAADSRLASIELKGTPRTLASAMDGPLHAGLFDAVIRGFLLRWDLPDLVRLMRSRTVDWREPGEWLARY